MTTHIERTAASPRHTGLHPCTLSRIQRVSPTVRLLTLALPYAVTFLPGQWVDLHIPSLRSPGGFTITSPPSSALIDPHESRNPLPKPLRNSPRGRFPPPWPPIPDRPVPRPFLELAIQKTSNPPAQWLWQSAEDILESKLAVRIGGSFIWPPANIESHKIDRVVFVAGGVGVNPFMSMLSTMYEKATTLPEAITFLYSTKATRDLREVLFLDRLSECFEWEAMRSKSRRLELHLTGLEEPEKDPSSDVVEMRRDRIQDADLEKALGTPELRPNTVAYVCGPGGMVDDMVKKLSVAEGMNEQRVFYEKWW